MKPELNKILVIQTAFIGDAILATSVIEKLHSSYPSALIDVLVRKGNESLFDQHPFLNKVLIWDKKESKYKSLWTILKKVRAGKYDLIVNLHRFASSGFITAFSGAEQKVGFDKNPFSFLFTDKFRHDIGNGKHEVERNHELIKKLTGEDFERPKLYPSDVNERNTAMFKEGKYVCMAPSSVWFTKQLPVEKWVELCNAVPAETRIYLLGAKGDLSLCEEIRKSSSHKNISVLAGRLSFLDSCSLMRDAQMNYVNDSAPLHLASAMNAPVTAFFCSTIPAFGFTPLSSNSRVIEITEKLECRPCGLHGHRDCPKGHFKCGYTIDIRRALN
ncbi:MAG: glycosyltransferase family 9 protein [Bacteroidia bacterium]